VHLPICWQQAASATGWQLDEFIVIALDRVSGDVLKSPAP
jgi:hypothetical protein